MKYILYAVLCCALSIGSVFAQVDISIVNINTADAESIARVLKGVGDNKAEAIVSYRTAHGDFKAIEELTEVKGIGSKLIEINQDRIKL